jgi:prepilin-type N-terminal cleavage/methylation domain-containing protein
MQEGIQMKPRQSGFTLVEIAIVLVIIGLLLGGILKGQELINNARVRNVADQENTIKAAIFAFQDRFRGLPGDYNQASTNVSAASVNGNGNSIIDTAAEQVQAWQQLTAAGFISCADCTGTGAALGPGNSPRNAFNGVMGIMTDAIYNDGAIATGPVRTNIKSGKNIPSNVLAEVDRKIDDGNPRTGTFRFSTWADAAPVPTNALCAGVGSDTWIVLSPDPNCGAASLL